MYIRGSHWSLVSSNPILGSVRDVYSLYIYAQHQRCYDRSVTVSHNTSTQPANTKTNCPYMQSLGTPNDAASLFVKLDVLVQETGVHAPCTLQHVAWQAWTRLSCKHTNTWVRLDLCKQNILPIAFSVTLFCGFLSHSIFCSP